MTTGGRDKYVFFSFLPPPLQVRLDPRLVGKSAIAELLDLLVPRAARRFAAPQCGFAAPQCVCVSPFMPTARSTFTPRRTVPPAIGIVVVPIETLTPTLNPKP